MSKTIIIKNLEELQKFAREILAQLVGEEDGATVLALYGDLGSGKTAFTKALAKELGINIPVNSPTFVLEKFYKIERVGILFTNLIHIDAYRLESGEDLKKLGWEEQIANPKNLIAIEWADIVEDIIPAGAVKLRFKFIDENTREIMVD